MTHRPDRVHLYRDNAGEYRWRRTAPNGEILSTSSEGYEHAHDAHAAATRTNPGLEILLEIGDER